MLVLDDFSAQLKKLGKHKSSAGSLYINKLADVDTKALEEIIDLSFNAMNRKYHP